MTSFDPNKDYTLPATENTDNADSLYEIIMDVQNTLKDISDLLLVRDTTRDGNETEQDASPELTELPSVYDSIFKKK
jgi:hypothetical protein